VVRWGPGSTALALVAVALVGCGGARHDAKAPDGAMGGACAAFDPLMDLYFSLTTPASFGSSSDLFYLVDLDEDLGTAAVAQRSLAALGDAEARPLSAQLDRLAGAMTKRRGELTEAIGAAEKTYEAAEKAIDEAATCDHVDMRDVKGKDGRTKLASKACESAVRLWSAAQGIDLTSDVSSSAVATQVGELRLEGDRARIRDRLAKTLKDHVVALRRFHAIAAPKIDDAAAGGTQTLSDQRDEVAGSLKTLEHSCFDRMRLSGRVIGGHAEPRNVTVVVRPKWSDALAQLPHDESFGSGFVVRWRAADGHVETRIVTNNHVMDGAFEADIVPGDRDASRSDDKEKTTATLIAASHHDDIAVLRVDPKSEAAFGQGLTLRLAPAREQEQVVAAGFPGVGVRPSFQVSKGTVSNAKFGAETVDSSEMSTYVQHTAPIDPGNSGGPLLDGDGNLLGMNTFKIVGRENVALAIPTTRIQLALVRAEQAQGFDAKHAEASCNAVVAALASARPSGEAMSRFGLALYESEGAKATTADAAAYRERVQKEPENPVEAARLRAYASVRAAVEQEHGVRPYEVCFDNKAGEAAGTYQGSFRTRSKTHQLTFAEEHGALRVVKVD
jgi:S1-C subfamily serine protease